MIESNMKNLLYFFLAVLIITVQLYHFGCSPPQTLKNPIFVSYSAETFSPTDVDDIEIFENRFDIPYRYTQIGVIKYDEAHEKGELLKIAAENGTHAVIFEDDNIVLLRFFDKEDANDEIPIEALNYNLDYAFCIT